MRKQSSGPGIGNDLRSELFIPVLLSEAEGGEILSLRVRPSFNMLCRLERLLGDEKTGSLKDATKKLLGEDGRSPVASLAVEAMAIVLSEADNLPDAYRDPDELRDLLSAQGGLNYITGDAPSLLMMLALLNGGPGDLVAWEEFEKAKDAAEKAESDDESPEDDEEEREAVPLPVGSDGAPSLISRLIWAFTAKRSGPG